MKINWKVRFKNRIFLLSLWSLLVVLAQKIATILGQDITVISGEITDVVEIVLTILGLLGIVQDPTNKGLSDTDRALNYKTPTDAYESNDDEAVG